MDTIEAPASAGVISITPEDLSERNDPCGTILWLRDLSLRGRLVGWGIWPAMNRLFREGGEEFFSAISRGEAGYIHFREATSSVFVEVSVSKGTRWKLAVTGYSHPRREFVIWDLWEWTKRTPKGGETPRKLYNAISRVANSLGVRCRHFYGPSAIASPLLRKYGVAEHYPEEEELGEPDLARWALFSGRMQVVKVGVSEEPAKEYDLNSAYAWGMSRLPSLKGARFRTSGGVDWDWFGRYGGWALMRVRWSIPKQSGRQPTPIYPFPVRVRSEDGGGVEYPRQGEGWYWSPLVVEAQKHFGQYMQVLECRHLELDSLESPFAWLADVYGQREYWKRGSLEDTILKWSLSCVWGKLCQRKEEKWRTNSRNLLWAGMATSIVNGELLRVAMIEPRRVWHIHVDSILLGGDRDHLGGWKGDLLGQWRCRRYQSVQQYRVGVWRGLTEDGWHEKTQGIPSGVLDWNTAEDEWRTFGPLGRVPVKWSEFQGFGCPSYEDWLTEKEQAYMMPCFPGKMVNLQEAAMRRRLGTLAVTFQPPDDVPNPMPYEDAEDSFGLDHNPERRQERFGA